MVERLVDKVPVHDVSKVNLSDWLEIMSYMDREEFLETAVVLGQTEEEYEARWREIVEEFYAWCDDNELNGNEV